VRSVKGDSGCSTVRNVLASFRGRSRQEKGVALGRAPEPLKATGRTSNAGCLGAMARICSSVESGPTPSKNTPTSSFQRFR
jgi:hypothetical protein